MDKRILWAYEFRDGSIGYFYSDGSTEWDTNVGTDDPRVLFNDPSETEELFNFFTQGFRALERWNQ